MFYHNCGSKIEEGEAFCAECGAKQQLQEAPASAQTNEKNKSFPRWVLPVAIGGAVIIAVTVVLILLWPFGKDGTTTPLPNTPQSDTSEELSPLDGLVDLLEKDPLFTAEQVERLHPAFCAYFTKALGYDTEISSQKLANELNNMQKKNRGVVGVYVTVTSYTEGSFSEVQSTWDEIYDFQGLPRAVYYTAGNAVFRYEDGTEETVHFNATAEDTYLFLVEENGVYYWITQ